MFLKNLKNVIYRQLNRLKYKAIYKIFINFINTIFNNNVHSDF